MKHIQRLIWDCNDEIKTGHFLAGTPKKRKQKYIFTYLKLKKREYNVSISGYPGLTFIRRVALTKTDSACYQEDKQQQAAPA